MNPVRKRRLDLYLSQQELARRADVVVRTIQSVEKGMNCRMDTKRKLLKALGVPFERRQEVFREQA